MGSIMPDLQMMKVNLREAEELTKLTPLAGAKVYAFSTMSTFSHCDKKISSRLEISYAYSLAKQCIL